MNRILILGEIRKKDREELQEVISFYKCKCISIYERIKTRSDTPYTLQKALDHIQELNDLKDKKTLSEDDELNLADLIHFIGLLNRQHP